MSERAAAGFGGLAMTRYLALRIAQGLLVIWLTYTVVFFAIQLLPSDPITIFLSGDTVPDPATIEKMRAYYGYDQPVIVQYLGQLGGLLRGDFGYSLASGQAVLDRIGGVIGSTLVLAASALGTALVLAFLIVTVGALTRFTGAKRILLNLPPLFSAIPVFWLGLLALEWLSIRLGVMPLFPDGSLISVLVPVLVLAIPISAPIAQVFLKSVESVYQQPFVTVLRAKGATPARIYFRHVLKNAAGPAITVLGVTVGALLAGSVITETVFGRSGLGTVLLQAVTAQDMALVQGLVLLTAVVFVVVNLIVDLIYPALDPRILTTVSSGAAARLSA